ncbi:uncharacterized protein LOC110997483 isoform X2 [Pieris rapae]|uniref:uncharacterized protein LOC110997483 isoform X2 n=1 Tax=Pieris rapae TaxID=64459 RepID=UPI001E27FCD8|nr:uncharacterized protein LOC110997483 isoform X2 [Pieris rapae]
MNNRRSRVYTAPVPKMPPGLLKLMEGLSEDVLRNKPSDIYEFCADHVQKLLQIRDDDRQRKKPTSLEQKIAKAQNIIRERAKQRRKCYEKNYQTFLEDNETRPAPDVVNDDTEDASVAKREMVQDNLPAYTSRREEITRELFDNNITYPNIVSGECRERQLENSNSKNNTFNENECTSDVSGNQLIKGAVVVSPTVIENANVLDEEFCSTDVKIHHNLTSPDYSASSGTIENIELEPKIPKEFPLSPDDAGSAREDNFEGVNFSEEAEKIRVCDEEDAASNVLGAHHQMDLETAAITIQKVFRTFLFKSKTTSLDDATNVDINLFIKENDLENNINMTNKERRGISRMDTVLQTVNEEKSLSLSTDDSSTLSSAATIIQAHIRGFLVRNKFNVNKTHSSTESMIDSKDFSGTSLEKSNDLQKTKTVLNIHIVPEKDNFPGRDESFATSMDLPMDDSLHLLSSHASYDIVERRKQLKREDAIQSVTPPSNTSSSKLSEDMDSVREQVACDEAKGSEGFIEYQSNVEAHEGQTAVEIENNAIQHSLEKDDETVNDQDSRSPLNIDSVHKIQRECTETGSLKHSSEFHEVILPTKVTRSDTSVVRGE